MFLMIINLVYLSENSINIYEIAGVVFLFCFLELGLKFVIKFFTKQDKK